MIYEIKKELIPVLAGIKVMAFNGEPWNDNWTLEKAIESLEEDLASPKFFGICMEKDGVIAGYVLGERSIFIDEKVFHIDELCVLPEFQRQGIGQYLLDALKQELREQEVASVSLMTGQNKSLHSFYKRNGFKIETEVVVMETKL